MNTISCRLIYLSTWSPEWWHCLVEAMKLLGRGAWVETVHHWWRSLRVYSLVSLPVFSPHTGNRRKPSYIPTGPVILEQCPDITLWYKDAPKIPAELLLCGPSTAGHGTYPYGQFTRETPSKKTNFPLASVYQLEVASQWRMWACVHMLLFTLEPRLLQTHAGLVHAVWVLWALTKALISWCSPSPLVLTLSLPLPAQSSQTS